MKPTDDKPTGERGRVGRPARIGPEEIARAVLDIGLSQVTMRAVAQRLGVSVPGLYHWVNGKEGLIRLAVEHSLDATPLPVDRGQPWWEWLREWARHTARSLGHDPGLLQRFISGTLGVEQMVVTLERVIDVLVREGFRPAEAMDAFDAVMAVSIGAAVRQVRDQGGPGGGQAFRDALKAAVGDDHEDYPRLLEYLQETGGESLDDGFEENLTVVLVGIAVRRGDDWERVAGEPA